MGIINNITENFSVQNDALPQPTFELARGNTPIIIAGPHNGHSVPPQFNDTNDHPLGLHPSNFDPISPFRRHESCDWGMAELFKALQDKETDVKHTYITAKHSRLVADLNRDAHNAITQKSSENGRTIAGNTGLSTSEQDTRIEQFHKPYHSQLENLITQTRTRHGYALVVDLHSFTPVWNGTPRDIEIGTVHVSNNATELFLRKNLTRSAAQQGFSVQQHYPYNFTTETEMGAIAQSIEAHGAQYAGLEIRNDLLQTPQGVETIAALISSVTNKLANDPTFAPTTAPESKILEIA